MLAKLLWNFDVAVVPEKQLWWEGLRTSLLGGAAAVGGEDGDWEGCFYLGTYWPLSAVLKITPYLSTFRAMLPKNCHAHVPCNRVFYDPIKFRFSSQAKRPSGQARSFLSRKLQLTRANDLAIGYSPQTALHHVAVTMSLSEGSPRKTGATAAEAAADLHDRTWSVGFEVYDLVEMQ